MINFKKATTMKIFASFALLLATATSAFADNPDGKWQMGNLTIAVRHCGGELLCGTIVSLGAKLNPDGTEKLDWKNPNPALRKRHVVGLPIFEGMAPTGPNSWKGTIYSADDGGTYRAYATMSGKNLDVQGCWGPFCKSLAFKRVN
jgi:uncharacterized protein (DUF2147 family)